MARISTTWQVHRPNFVECILAQVFEFTVIALQARAVMPAKQSIEKPSSRVEWLRGKALVGMGRDHAAVRIVVFCQANNPRAKWSP